MSTTHPLISYIFLFAALCTAAPLSTNLQSCSQSCNIHFCRESLGKLIKTTHGSINIIRAPGDPMTGAFCKDDNLLVGVQLRSPVVRRNASENFIPLTKFMTAVVKPQFPEAFFGVMRHTEYGETLTHIESLGNQNQYLDNLCVTIPLRLYSYIHEGSNSRIKLTNDSEDCISFLAVAPKLIFELSWYSQDDLDIVITEPSDPPTRISRFDPMSENGGRLLFDEGSEGIQLCAQPTTPGTKKRESIFYMRDYAVPRGTYKVEVHHHRNCHTGPTHFKVKVLVNGNAVLSEIGVSNADYGSIAAEYMVDISA